MKIPIMTCLLLLTFACRSVSPQTPYELSISLRDSAIPDSEMKSVAFNFCPLQHSFSLTNGLWLTYFAADQYSHFKVVGPHLEQLGFGDRGDGKAYFKLWYLLRLRRIFEKSIDTDDTWKDEAGRIARYKSVQAEYESTFSEKYFDDGKTAFELENLASVLTKSNKIKFFTGKAQTTDKTFVKGVNQAFYAENTQKDFSLISFRGSEFDERGDVLADASLLQKKWPEMGYVHQGFLAAYQEFETELIQLLTEKTRHKPMHLWITGHSLGGAIATLFTAKILMLHEKGELPNLRLMGTYTIGSPRVGNLEFAKTFDNLATKQNVTVVRIRNHGDSVTNLPVGVAGYNSYWHVGSLAYASGQGKLYFDVDRNRIETESDFASTYSPSINDHSLIGYWTIMKKAYEINIGTRYTDCAPSSSDRPPVLFYEYNAAR